MNFLCHYTLERDNRELQQYTNAGINTENYTLERDNRELQRIDEALFHASYYTLERDTEYS